MRASNIIVALGVLASSAISGLAADRHVKISASYSLESVVDREVVNVFFMTQRGDEHVWKAAPEILDPSSGAPDSPDTYELTDENGQKVEVTPILGPKETALKSNIKLIPASRLKKDAEYRIKIHGGKLVFKVASGASTLTESNEESVFVLSKEQIRAVDLDMDRLQTGLKRNSIELGGGNAGGIGSAKLTLEKYGSKELNVWGARLDGSADFTLSSRDRSNYLNSISGELALFKIWHPQHFAPVEFDVHGKVQTEQTFKLVDGFFGTRAAFYSPDPVTAWISGAFCGESDRAPALLLVGYDYVHNLSGDNLGVVNRTGVNSKDGSHQVSGTLRWRIPLLRKQDLNFLPALKGTYDVDIEMDLKGAYDSTSSKFLDQSQIALTLTRMNSANFKPAFTFAWVRGKEGPTYEQISALLAGMKLSW